MRQRNLSWSLMIALVLATPMADAAGFGRLKVLSHLNEPLNAEIDLTQVNPEDLPGMSAKIAASELFREANVPRPALADELKLSIEKRSDGQSFIRVTSSSQISDSAFDLLIEVNWPAGRLIRDYAFEVNPAKLSEVEVPAPVKAPQVSEAKPSTEQKVPSESEPSSALPSVPTDKTSAPAPASATPKTVKVKTGDTLGAISARIKPETVSLEQSMLAVFEANRRAFLRGNVNLIRAGATLTVPEGGAWTGRSAESAREELHLMAEDFEAYKATLAKLSHSAPAVQESLNETANGKISGSAEDKKAPAPKGKQDVLRLSRKDDAASDPKAREDLQKEEAIVHENELKEAKERAEALEKNVEAMKKKLAEKESASHSEESSEPKAIPAPEAALPEVIKPVLSDEEKEKARQAKAQEEGDADAPKHPKKEAKKEKEKGTWALLLGHPIVVVAGLLTGVLLGWLALSFLRRRSRVTDEESDEHSDSEKAQEATQAETPASAEAPVTDEAAPPIKPRENVDPIEEADVYIAYGRLTQAEEILLKGMANHPGRLEILKKLMDVYVQQDRKTDFERSFKTLMSLASPDNPLLAEVRQMGRTFDPSNTLYQEISIVPPPVALDSIVPPIPGESLEPAKSLADIDLSLAAPEADKAPEPIAEDESGPAAQEMNTKLDLARAYLEIEDKDNARELLAEVIDKGTSRQKTEAEKLLKELGA